MTATAVVILATQLVTLLAAILSLWSSRRNKSAIETIHVAINSRMDELLKLTADSSRAAGAKEEKDNPT